MIQAAWPENRPRGAAARRDFTRSPLLVFYEVTRACDLVCLHCRACAQTEPLPSELPTGMARALIDQLAQFPEPPMLIVTGGDPLKRRDIYGLIWYATSIGLDVSITPSATPLVTRDAVRKLKEAGISRMAISIDGADAATHDRMRGVSGSFNRSLEILGYARDEGVPTQINTTITPDNFDQIDRMADLFGRQDIVMWSVFFLVPVGRAEAARRLSPEQYEIAFERLWQQSRCQYYGIKTTEAPHYRRYVLQRRLPKSRANGETLSASRYASVGTNDGKGVMFVSHSGLIHPSGFLPMVCGMFPLNHVVQVYQDSPIFRGLRDAGRLKGKCGACEFRHVCGGSRARAYAVTGDPFAQEPDCNYMPAGYTP